MGELAGSIVVRLVLDMFHRVSVAPGPDQAIKETLDGLARLIPCDVTAANTVDPTSGAMRPMFHPQAPWTDAITALAPHVRRHPIIAHFGRVPDREARRTTDLCSEHDWLRNPVYTEVFGPQGLRYQLGFGLQVGSGKVAGVTLTRATINFSDEETRLFTVVAPRALELSRRVNGGAVYSLTPREREISELLVTGLSSSSIAARMACSVRTVDKHLEHVYRKLNVQSNTAAIAKLLTMTVRREPD